MKTIDEIKQKLSLSSKEITNSDYEFNENDILSYFEAMVNDSKYIHVPRFELEITNKTGHEDKIVIYIPEENKFIFNMGLIYFETKQLDVYSINIKCLEIVNRIIAKIELFRMLDNSLVSYIEPVFFIHIAEELYKNDGILIDNYLNIRSLQLTDHFIRIANEKYPFRGLIKTFHYKEYNETILAYYQEENNYCPLHQARVNDSDNQDYSKDILNKFGKKAYQNYLIAKDNYNFIGESNLINSLLLGKPINKEKYPDIEDMANKMSLFEYAYNLNEYEQNKLADKYRK